MKYAAALALLVALPPVAAAQTVPDGWSKQQHGDELRVSPRGLRSDQVVHVAGLPDEAVSGRELRAWFDRRTSRDAHKLGAVDSEKPIEPVSGGVLKKALAVRTADGRRLAVVYFGGLGATKRFELYRIVSTPDRALAEKHMENALKVITSWPSRPAAGSDEAASTSPAKRERAMANLENSSRELSRPGVPRQPVGMRKPILICLVTLLCQLAASAAPVAADPAPGRSARARPRAGAARPVPRARPPARKPPARTYDFTGDAIDGSRIQPDGTTIFGLRDPRFPSLIDVRGDFLREVTRSADRLP